MTADGHAFSYGYDGAGRMNRLTNDNSETTRWAYQDNGWLQSKALSNGVVTTFTRDPQGRLLDLANQALSGKTDYAVPATGGYDGVGNRLSVTTTNGNGSDRFSGTTTYQYDYGQSATPRLNRSQLTQETSTRNFGYTNTFAYDGGTAGGPGNLTGFKGSSFTYNADNQISNPGVAYDGAGNPTTYKGQSLTFDPENRMTAYGTYQTYQYTADGLRAWKQTGTDATTRTYFLYDGSQPVLEESATGSLLAVTTFGADGLVSSHRSGAGAVWYLFDEHGNTTQRTDSTGTVTGNLLYDAYGYAVLIALPIDPFWYGGQAGYYTDETGLILCTHRFYDPQVGRFVTRDPLGYAGGINLYGYCGNNPGNRWDPLGYDVTAGAILSGGLRIAGGAEVLGGGPEDPVADIAAGAILLGAGLLAGGAIIYNQTEGDPPANLSPPGAGRGGALGQAKRNNGIPVSQQPTRVGPNRDRSGNVQPGREYEYDKPGGGSCKIRDDAGGHDYGPGDPQNRGPHFNDPAGNHYDYPH